MKFNPYVFRKYDIRGIVEEDFSDIFVNALGKSFGTKVKRIGIKEIAISGDVRLSTNNLKDNFIEGALSTGVDIIDLGILPTPTNYYSMWKLDVKACVQVTGSHNPSNMNGFKFSVKYISLGIKSLTTNGNDSAAKINLSRSPNCSFKENLGK